MKNLYFVKKNPIFKQKCNKIVINLLVVVGLFVSMINPGIIHAQVITIDGVNLNDLSVADTKIEITSNVINSLPVISSRKPTKVVNMVITAYTSHEAQTDSTPCITASGMDVCERGAEDIVATNFDWLPFGTKIKIPELFGDRVFVIHDRMNARYSKRVDVWMKSYADAIKFGKKYTAVEIY